MNICKFHLITDEQDDFFREIEIRGNQTFRQLHDFLIKNLNLKKDELASFFIVDDFWNRMLEITLIDMAVDVSPDDEKSQVIPEVFLMDEVKIDRFVKEIGQKLIYEYDFLQLHGFRLELTEFVEPVPHRRYPYIAAAEGTLVLRDNLRIDIDTERLKQELLSEFEDLVRDDADDDDDDESGTDDDY
ncbi:MAG: plasmid pRiA4b ORF-3 family protein [Bacteroidales bacterium]|nr:plasmid pRiA4b ORF-3 family protein [Bacteroidales bacterium]